MLAGNAPGLSGDLLCRDAWQLHGGHVPPVRETPRLSDVSLEAWHFLSIDAGSPALTKIGVAQNSYCSFFLSEMLDQIYHSPKFAKD
jgi:hypothetical protein